MDREKNPDKALYQQLRTSTWNQLWKVDVPRFNEAPPAERRKTLALIRAVGVVFSESGPASQQVEVRLWLRSLLHDPEEKIRRYAINALPKIGAESPDENELVALLKNSENEREKKYLGKALDKIGSTTSLENVDLSPQTEQKIKATIARTSTTSEVRFDAIVSDIADVKIHLRTRFGLEGILEDETKTLANFRILSAQPGLVTLSPRAPFTLRELYTLRTFGTLSFVLGTQDRAVTTSELANVIAAEPTHRLLQTLTHGPLRYRLEYTAKGHQRGAIRETVTQAYALNPEILNDSREAPWAIEVFPFASGECIELRPRLSPDPRFGYRQHDVPAASHPPLAAAMARLAGPFENEVVWDPFCGSGLELIERARLGGVKKLYGSDRNPTAISIAQINLRAAGLETITTHFERADFRDFSKAKPEHISLILTNPPMGKRVPIDDLGGLLEDLFSVAARVLKPGGRLILPNPLPVRTLPRSLKKTFSRTIDLGGFDCELEMYQKANTNPHKEPHRFKKFIHR